MKLRKVLYGAGIGLLLITVLIIDVVRKSVDLDLGGLGLVRDIIILCIFVLAFLLLEMVVKTRDQSPVKRMGLALVGSVIAAVAGVAGSLMMEGGFDAKNLNLLPLGYETLFMATAQLSPGAEAALRLYLSGTATARP